MIPGDLLSAFPHRQFYTLPGLLDSWAALPNYNPNACMPMQGGSLYHFYVKYVDANLDAPDNAISGNEPSSEMLTSQSQIPE